MAKEMSNREKKMNPFLRILFAIILPLFVALFLAVIVLSMIGIDIVGWTEEQLTKTPIISSFVKTEDEKSLMEKLEKANDTIETQKGEIADLQSEIEQLEAQIDNMEIEMAKLENQLDDETLEMNDLEEDVDIKKLASSFRNMDKEQAANIVANLDVANAVLLLNSVSGDVRGAILEEMDPKVAANLMEQMMR